MNNKIIVTFIWIVIALLGAAAVGDIALNRGEPVNAL